MKRISVVMAVAALMLAAVTVFGAPALAHHNADHDGGQGTEQQDSKGDEQGKNDKEPDGDADSADGQTTEDNDDDNGDGTSSGSGDLPNNVPDEKNDHPSGKDKSVEQDKGNQGNSESNPDNDGHGPERNSCPGSGWGECIDKPGGDGGEDTYDQDGNNGCGNDDDFEDDNEGRCLGRKKNVPQTGTTPDTDTVIVDIVKDEDLVKPDDDETIVLDERVERDVDAARPETGTDVEGAVLPFTGAGVFVWVFVGGALLLVGSAALKARRS